VTKDLAYFAGRSMGKKKAFKWIDYSGLSYKLFVSVTTLLNCRLVRLSSHFHPSLIFSNRRAKKWSLKMLL